MSNITQKLLSILELSEVEARTTEHTFIGSSQKQSNGRVFGGQVLAQAIVAANRTVPQDRAIHSMHGYFLRPGDANLPITFSVDKLRDGRSFSARRTQAFQKGVPIFSMIGSFQTQDIGLEHHRLLSENIVDPEDLPHILDTSKDNEKVALKDIFDNIAFDIRHSPSPIFFNNKNIAQSHQYVWMKLKDSIPDDPILHIASLAYVSDFTILESILRQHNISWSNPGIKIASLDHAMWWYRTFRADEWLIYVQDSPNSSGGRGVAYGHIYNRSGALVASVVQEGMIRVRNKS